MKYQNKNTGAVIEAESVLGGDWMPVKEPKKADKAEKTEEKKGKSKK